MNTDLTIHLEDLNIQIESLNIPVLTKNEKNLLLFYTEFTRYIKEIEALFRMYRVNLNILHAHYIFYNDDTVDCKVPCYDSDYIGINALIINLLGSGKTLIESIEGFIKFTNEYILENNNSFKEDCISYIYDKNFSYRLLIFLRNFSQHGHLPVSKDNNRYCFDLQRILQTPHFNMSKRLQKEMANICDEIYKLYKGYPKIVLTKSLVEYNFSIHYIYAKFWESIENIFDELITSVKKIIENKPDIIQHSESKFIDGCAVFTDHDNNYHSFYVDENIGQLVSDFKKDAEIHFHSEKVNKEHFDNTMKLKKNVTPDSSVQSNK